MSKHIQSKYSLGELRQFVEVANCSSFSNAAINLNQTIATVSAGVKRLEKNLQTRLFERSTRSVRLTEAGSSLYATSVKALTILDSGMDALRKNVSAMSGKITLSAPTDLIRTSLGDALQQFQRQHPHILLEIRVSDALVKLVDEPVDLAVRYGFPPDSNYIARLLSDSNRVACASPDYVSKHGILSHPADLIRHKCLCYKVSNKVEPNWLFYNGKETISVPIVPTMITDDSAIARKWALDGLGIVYKSQLDLDSDMKSGQLVNVLPNFTGSSSPIYLVYPSAINQPSRTKTLIDSLLHYFTG